MKNGWHTVKGYEVYVEDNKIMHGTDKKHTVTMYPYHSTNYGIMNAVGVKVETFRKSEYYFMK